MSMWDPKYRKMRFLIYGVWAIFALIILHVVK